MIVKLVEYSVSLENLNTTEAKYLIINYLLTKIIERMDVLLYLYTSTKKQTLYGN
jgi:hypothetical protein